MTVRVLPTGRGVFLALAAVALALTVLRPACERWLAHAEAAHGSPAATAVVAPGAAGHDAPAKPCCSSVSDLSYASPLIPATGEWKTPAGVASLFLVLLIPASKPRRLNPRRAPPRGAPSFYLRSTRILR